MIGTHELGEMIGFFGILGLCGSALVILAVSALCAVMRSILNLMGRG